MSADKTQTDLGTLDISKPNAARIYDYLLGGSHNFEADRKGAEQINSAAPWIAKGMRLQRACLQDIAHELTTVRGFDVVIDFASGLPTQDHIHAMAKPGTLVLYSDRDPTVVEFAREILKGNPDTYVFSADARYPNELLNNPEVQALLKGRRAVAFVLWGVAIFLTDAELKQTMKTLYELAGPGSTLAFSASAADVDSNDPAIIESVRLYERFGTKIYPRSLGQIQELIEPWQPDASGFVSLLKWHGLETSVMTPQDLRSMGSAGGGYGAYLIK
jgi:O-methyltransferase involved in polyketide biosynthesis